MEEDGGLEGAKSMTDNRGWGIFELNRHTHTYDLK